MLTATTATIAVDAATRSNVGEGSVCCGCGEGVDSMDDDGLGECVDEAGIVIV